MKLFLPLFFGLLLTTNIYCSSDDRDGNWWRTQNPRSKTAYVIGIMDGTFAVSGLERARMTPEDFNAHQSNLAVLIGKARAGQIVEGLDILYRDFRNRNILVAKAFWTVTMEINGIPSSPEQLEKRRQEAASR
jgi:hypothetical protein